MNKLSKIKIDHYKKSNQVKKLKKKLKNKAKHTLDLSHIEHLLAYEKKYTIDPREYYYLDDSSGYARDSATRDARINLLEEILNTANKKINK